MSVVEGVCEDTPILPSVPGACVEDVWGDTVHGQQEGVRWCPGEPAGPSEEVD